VTEVESGKGTLHEVIYGENGKQAISDLSSAAREIDAVVREVREGKGVLHSLVYEEGNSNFLRELNELSATLNRVVQDIDKGRGTIGGLVRDPTVYEDLKTTLGNVQRNVLLKALIRYTVDKENLRRGESAPKVQEQGVSADSPKP
jgi:phospholipid/cholesterol/gamma-HCH transport system substrate-binding protein